MIDRAEPVQEKISPPLLDASPLVPRQPLLDRVARRWQAGGRPVLRVEARPGQGKSVFAAQLLEHLGLSACWYRMDPRDRDPRTLAAGVLASLRKGRLDPQEASGLRTRGTRSLVRRLAEELCRSAPPDRVLVVDDLHRVEEAAEAVALLRALVEAAAPEGARFVLLSRRPTPRDLLAAAPSLKVACRSLRFSVRESAALCRRLLGVSATRPALRRLGELCEGWVVGLLLHLRHLEGCAPEELEGELAHFPSRVLPEIEAYFDREVLPEVHREIADALVRLSLLDGEGFSGDQAEALVGPPGAREALRRMVGQDLFVRAAEAPAEVFVLHPLFREYLRARGRRSLPPSRIASLRAAAVRWHEGRGDFEAALRNAAGAGDPNLVERLLRSRGEELVLANRLGPVRLATASLGADDLHERPHACYLAGLVRFATTSEEALPLLERAAELFRGRGDAAGELKALIHVLFYRLMMASDYRGAIPALGRARELHTASGPKLEERSRVQAGHVLAVGSAFVDGRLEEADRLSAEALWVAEAAGEPGLLASALSARLVLGIFGSHAHRVGPEAERAWALLPGSDLSEMHRAVLGGLLANLLLARRNAAGFRRQTDNLWRRFGADFLDSIMLGPLLRLWEAECFGQEGRWEEAEQTLRNGFTRGATARNLHLRSLYLQVLAYALAAGARAGEAVRTADESRALRRRAGGQFHALLNAVYAGGAYALAEERERAEEALGEAVQAADRGKHPDLAGAARAHRALLRLSGGDGEGGLEDLRAAMAFIRDCPRPRPMPYGWFPETLTRLLGAAVARGVEPELARRVATEELGIALRPDGSPSPLPRLRTLGGLELAMGDRVVLRRHELTEVQRGLLGRLAAAPGLEVGQEKLQSELWPGSPIRKARSALNTALSRLRRSLEKAAGGEMARDHLVFKNGILRLEDVLVDDRAFEDRVREGLRLTERGRLWAATLALRSGLGLWKGDFLAGVSLEGEAEARRLGLRTLHLRGTRAFARILLERGEEDEAAEVLEQALCHHPVDPELSGALHDLWARRDRPERAAEVMERFERALAEAGYSEGDQHAALARFAGSVA